LNNKKNQTLFSFFRPASKQSASKQSDTLDNPLQKVRDYVDESKYLTNWLTVEHNGWNLIATLEQHDWCSMWKTLGCINYQQHYKLGKGRCAYIKQFQRSCYRPACKVCYPKWIARQANVSTQRIEKFKQKSNREPIHLLLSVNPHEYYLSHKELKKRIKKILKIIEFDGGAIIFHPFKFRNNEWYYAPHFHIVGFGCRSLIFKGYGKFGWLVKDMDERRSVFQTFCYLLSHCGIKKGVHTVSWLGKLSYSKLKVEKEPNIACCPLCGDKFVEVYYDGFDPLVPPDKYFEGVSDSDGWYPVKTYEYSEPMYDYAPTRDLDELLKGLATAN